MGYNWQNSMKKQFLLLVPMVLALFSCGGDKLNNSIWYNATMVNNDGTWGTVMTSLAFYKDSVYAYNGVVVDDSVAIPAYLYAKGVYQCAKSGKNMYEVNIQGVTDNAKPYIYSGKLDNSEKVMRLSLPGQKTNETYFMDEDSKKPSEIFKNKKK